MLIKGVRGDIVKNSAIYWKCQCRKSHPAEHFTPLRRVTCTSPLWFKKLQFQTEPGPKSSTQTAEWFAQLMRIVNKTCIYLFVQWMDESTSRTHPLVQRSNAVVSGRSSILQSEHHRKDQGRSKDGRRTLADSRLRNHLTCVIHREAPLMKHPLQLLVGAESLLKLNLIFWFGAESQLCCRPTTKHRQPEGELQLGDPPHPHIRLRETSDSHSPHQKHIRGAPGRLRTRGTALLLLGKRFAVPPVETNKHLDILFTLLWLHFHKRFSCKTLLKSIFDSSNIYNFVFV